MANRAGYQPLSQSAEEADVGEVLPSPVTHRTQGLRRPLRPGHIDLSKLDNAFKRSVHRAMLMLTDSYSRTGGLNPLRRRSSGKRKWRIIRGKRYSTVFSNPLWLQPPQMSGL